MRSLTRPTKLTFWINSSDLWYFWRIYYFEWCSLSHKYRIRDIIYSLLWYRLHSKYLRSATPSSYEAFSHDNITNAEKQRVSSCRQRELNEHTMHQTSNDLHKQAETVNESFRIRIQEMITAKTMLEENLNQVNHLGPLFPNLNLITEWSNTRYV